MRDDDSVSNPSDHPTFEAICATRRALLQSVGSGAALAITGMPLAGCSTTSASPVSSARPASPTFRSIPAGRADAIVVPDGYEAYVLYAWGDPVSDGPAFRQDASNSAAEQERQAGMHHDALHFFPMVEERGGRRVQSSDHGLLVINHEYTDDGLLHPDGMKTWSAEKVRKSQAAHGVSVIEVRKSGEPLDGGAAVDATRGASPATRRCALSGPAAGDPALRHRADPAGRTVLGHVQQLRAWRHAVGHVPDLRGELQRLLRQRRRATSWRGRRRPAARDHRGSRHGARRAVRLPLARARRALRRGEAPERAEPLRLGGRDRSVRPVVDSPSSAPRSAASSTRARRSTLADGRPRRRLHGRRRALRVHLQVRVGAVATARATARPTATLLDDGTLYVARFDADGDGALAAAGATAQGRSTAGERLREPGRRADPRPVGGRRASARRKMDRPEWIAVSPQDGDVYCTLTNNVAARRARTGPAPTPRIRAPNNVFGHIVRWREDGGDAASTRVQVGHLRAVRRPVACRRDEARATSRATPTAARTACGSTRAGSCGSRPTSRPRRSDKGDYANMATT